MDYNHTIQLKDGRVLAYSEHGVPDGTPILYFHGAPGSCFEHLPKTLLNNHSIRLIVPDRPGYGGSTFQANRTLLSWADDVVQLLNALALETIPIFGFSAGGVYALACAYKIPERLNNVTIAGSLAPFNIEGLTQNLLEQNKALFENAKSDPTALVEQLEEHAPTADAFFAAVETLVSDEDKKLLNENKELKTMYLSNLAGAIQQGMRGFVHDLAILSSPWGFEVAQISKHITLWQGQLDRTVPIEMYQYFSKTLPQNNGSIIECTGHFITFSHAKKILEDFILD